MNNMVIETWVSCFLISVDINVPDLLCILLLSKLSFAISIVVYSIVIFFILEFFRKKGVCTLTVKELFDFVTDTTITEYNIDNYLDQAMTLTSSRTPDDETEQQKVDEQVGIRKLLIHIMI